MNLTLTQVDGVYFKVHRDLLARASGAIKDMLAIPVGEDPSQAEGSTVDNAITIPEVPYQHFVAILQAVYGRCAVVADGRLLYSPTGLQESGPMPRGASSPLVAGFAAIPLPSAVSRPPTAASRHIAAHYFQFA